MYLLFTCLYFSWLALQNFLLPWVYKSTGMSSFTAFALLATKEAILLLMLIVLARRVFRPDWMWVSADKWALLYVGVLTFYLLFAGPLLGSSIDWPLRLVSFRSLVTMALFYFWGRLSCFSILNVRRFGVFIVLLQVGAAIFGLFEWGLLPDTFWSDVIGVGDYMSQVKGLAPGWNVVDGLPANAWKFDVRRLMSVYADPLGMGIASVFPLILAIALWQANGEGGILNRHRKFWAFSALLIGAALVLTIARESIGVALLAIGLIAVLQGRVRLVVVTTLILSICLLLYPPALHDVIATVTFQEETAATHLSFLVRNWEVLPRLLVGMGLGEAGGWAFSLAGIQSDVGESSYFELMAQGGILSVFLLIGFFVSLARKAVHIRQSTSDLYFSALLAAIAANLVARMIMTIFSPSIFGVIPMASFFFACGAALSAAPRSELVLGAVVAPPLISSKELPASS